MPVIGPEPQTFTVYLDYDAASPNTPRFTAYMGNLQGDNDEDAQLLQQHAEDGGFGFRMTVTRTVTEDQFKRSTENFTVKISNSVTIAAALTNIEQRYPGQFKEYAKACWHSARGGFSQHFPQMFPRP